MANTYETRAREVEINRFGPLDWSAIFAGAIIALVVHFLLNLLGASIGAAAIDVTPGGTMGVAALGWWSLSGVVAAFTGGVIAGGLASRSGHHDAITHGLLAWAVPTLVMVAAVAGLIGGATASVSNIAGPLGADVNALRALQELAPADEAAVRAQTEAIADRASASAFASFVALVIGAFASMFGAFWIMRRRHGWPVEIPRGDPSPVGR